MSVQFCSFVLGGALFGIASDAVKEIVMQRTVLPVPLSPPALAGLMNHRGHVLSVVDLGAALGFGRTAGATVILVEQDKETFGLLVEKIGDVVSVNFQDGELLPESAAPAVRCAANRTYKLPDALMLSLDLAALFRLVLQGSAA